MFVTNLVLHEWEARTPPRKEPSQRFSMELSLLVVGRVFRLPHLDGDHGRRSAHPPRVGRSVSPL